MYSPLTSMIRDIAVQLPVILVCLVGLVFALMNYSRMPRPALLAAAGLATLLLLMLIRPLVVMVVSRMVRGSEQVMLIFGILHFFFNIIEAAAMGAIISAVFANRQPTGAAKSFV